MPSLIRSRPRSITSSPAKLSSTRFYRLASLVEKHSSPETISRALNATPSRVNTWVRDYISQRDRQIVLLANAIDRNPRLKEADARNILGIPAPFFKIVWKNASVLKRRKEYLEHKGQGR